MFVPLSKNPVVAFTFATAKVPEAPLSVNVKRVFGVASESWIVKTPLLPAVAKVIAGVLFDNTIGSAPENVAIPEISASVTPDNKPVFVIPPT